MNQLPQIGYLRLSQIIGQSALTEEQAAKNRSAGKGPIRPRAGIPAILPISKSAWYVGVRDGRYPKPVKLGPCTTAWRIEDVRALLEGGSI